MGIFVMPFLDVEGERNTDLVIRHIEHAIQVCGEDHVGIGSDLSINPIEETPEYKTAAAKFVQTRQATGNAAPGEDLPLYIPELNHPDRIRRIAAAMRARGHSLSRIEKVIGGNFARVLKEIWIIKQSVIAIADFCSMKIMSSMRTPYDTAGLQQGIHAGYIGSRPAWTLQHLRRCFEIRR